MTCVRGGLEDQCPCVKQATLHVHRGEESGATLSSNLHCSSSCSCSLSLKDFLHGKRETKELSDYVVGDGRGG